MQALSDSFGLAFGLIVGLDPDLLEIVSLSLKVSLVAVTFALILGLPLGAALEKWNRRAANVARRVASGQA